MVLMIIKGLFRRYKRWNPVHPTSGAFWGMGVGIGCGIGWGPGFGPDVIGYVGAGCGVGFSVGITFAGFGIGLPANFLLQLPYKAIKATRNGELEIALSNARRFAGDGWNSFAPRVFGFQREATERFSSFKQKQFLDKGFSIGHNVMSMMPVKPIQNGLGRFRLPFFRPGKDLKD